ncbi:MAG: hypothetical protein AB1305_00080 [Candidatus Hadarchaeota archaeon]
MLQNFPFCGGLTKQTTKQKKQKLPLTEIIIAIVASLMIAGILWSFFLLQGPNIEELATYIDLFIILASFAVGAVLLKREYPGP